ncbi:unnamed protein product [Schistosoma spindalis]|nr:unnamed protein product [Schistosoma spindale]
MYLNTIRRGFVEIVVISMIKIMSQLKLDHHEKPGSTGRPFRLIMALFSNAHPRPHPLRDSNPTTLLNPLVKSENYIVNTSLFFHFYTNQSLFSFST